MRSVRFFWNKNCVPRGNLRTPYVRCIGYCRIGAWMRWSSQYVVPSVCLISSQTCALDASLSRMHKSGQIITTSPEVTLNGGLIRELPQNPLNSGLGIILICPDKWDVSQGNLGSMRIGSPDITRFFWPYPNIPHLYDWWVILMTQPSFTLKIGWEDEKLVESFRF